MDQIRKSGYELSGEVYAGEQLSISDGIPISECIGKCISDYRCGSWEWSPKYCKLKHAAQNPEIQPTTVGTTSGLIYTENYNNTFKTTFWVFIGCVVLLCFWGYLKKYNN